MDLDAEIARIADEMGLNEKRVVKIGDRVFHMSRITEFTGNSWVVAVSDLERTLGEKAVCYIVES